MAGQARHEAKKGVLFVISIEETKKIIVTNTNISDAIFFGKGLFEEPFNSNFIYSKGELTQNHIPPFTITTGSGRHKGNYTVIIKP